MKTYVNEVEIENPHTFVMTYLNGDVKYFATFQGFVNFNVGDRIKFVYVDFIIEFDIAKFDKTIVEN